jgi:hypothetical protein
MASCRANNAWICASRRAPARTSLRSSRRARVASAPDTNAPARAAAAATAGPATRTHGGVSARINRAGRCGAAPAARERRPLPASPDPRLAEEGLGRVSSARRGPVPTPPASVSRQPPFGLRPRLDVKVATRRRRAKTPADRPGGGGGDRRPREGGIAARPRRVTGRRAVELRRAGHSSRPVAFAQASTSGHSHRLPMLSSRTGAGKSG